MIDAPGAPDRDDALWVEPDDDGHGWVATVHVADVCSRVPARGKIEAEAATRLRSTYHPGGHHSMLPRSVESSASLTEGQRRQGTCAVSFHVTLDGETSGVHVQRGRLNAGRILTYGQVPDILADPAHELHAPVVAAHDCARMLLTRRREAGALAIYDLSRGWAASEEGTLTRLAEAERNAGYVVVQEVMIAANAAVAACAVEHDCPILYRCHRAALATPPRAELLRDLEALSTEAGEGRFGQVQENLATVLRRATYEACLYPHFGLNLPAYTHATSPLRRFPDLATQRNLLALADGQAPVYGHDELAAAAAAINTLDSQRKDARTAREKRKTKDRSRRELDHAALETLSGDGFFKVLKLAAGEDRPPPGLQAEIHRRLDAGLLGPREAHRLLATAGHEWAPVRKATLAWLAGQPEQAISVVSQHGQHAGGSPEWTEDAVGTDRAPRFAAAVALSGTTSATRTGPSKASARQQAAVSLLARIAGEDDISTDVDIAGAPAAAAGSARQPGPMVVDPDRNPVSQLNEAAQAGVITELCWGSEHEGPPHAPVFTATVTGRRGGEVVAAAGQDGSKAGAKTAAGWALLARFAGGDSADHDQTQAEVGGR